MPASFDFAGRVFAPGLRFDVYTPAVMDEMRSWGNTLSVVGRLKPGVTLKQAQAESDTVFAGIAEERSKSGAYGRIKVDFSPTLTGLKEHVVAAAAVNDCAVFGSGNGDVDCMREPLRPY